ncbi:unnamed protein product, partial [Hapterophycus canaliculatus]
WRPSFGSGRGGGQSPTGAMHAPWAAFSTPSRDRDWDRDGGGPSVPPSASSAMGGSLGSASARRRRGSGAGNGPLGRLLQQVRTRCDGDEARLLSGEFPFRQVPAPKATAGSSGGGGTPDGGETPRESVGSGSGRKGRRDHGDPRTRCGVAADVTLLPLPAAVAAPGLRDGWTVGSGASLWSGASEGVGARQGGGGAGAGLVRFSCLVHRVVDVSSGGSGGGGRKSSNRTSPSDRPASSGGGAGTAVGLADSEGVAASLRHLLPLEGGRVDALFKQDTRRALDLRPGSQLRIYDPCCVWHDAETGQGVGEGEGGGALLMCTQLCEPYPSSLPPLPPPSVAEGVPCG